MTRKRPPQAPAPEDSAPDRFELLRDIDEWLDIAHGEVEDPGAGRLPDNFEKLTNRLRIWCVKHGIDPAPLWDLYTQSLLTRLGISDEPRLSQQELRGLSRKCFGVLQLMRDWKPDAAGGKTADAGTGGGKARKRHRPKTRLQDRPLTERQVEAVTVVGECNGNITAAALRLGKDRKTVSEAYHAALRKLGRKVTRPKTANLPRDKRGQENVSEDRRKL